MNPADSDLSQQLFRDLEQKYADTWQSLIEIEAKFRAHGHCLYLVGGAVRNLVLGLPLKDFDLATDALPDQTIRMFRNVIPTGIQHGTVTLVFRRQHFEITTFRLDGAYSDARRPDSVAFTPDIHEDLKRRDFTINAMALDLGRHCLIDPHGGRRDLARGLIRTVGIAQERFNEDGLRIMRALRFAAQLEFSIETATWAAMGLRLERLGKVSVERFRDELLKTLDSPLPSRGLFLMRTLGALELFLPGFGQMDEAGFAQVCLTIDLLPAQPMEPRLAALFSGIAPDAAKLMLASLRLPNATVKVVDLLLRLLPLHYDPAWTAADLRRLACRAGRDLSPLAVTSLNAQTLARDWLAYNPAEPAIQVPVAASTESDEPLEALSFVPAWVTRVESLRALPDPQCRDFIKRMDQILSSQCALSIGELKVDGTQLQAAGIPSGRQLGVILSALLQRVLENPALNELECLLDLARSDWAAYVKHQESGNRSS